MVSLLIAVIVAAIIFDYINGFHDAANAIATVVSTDLDAWVQSRAGDRLRFEAVDAAALGATVQIQDGAGQPLPATVLLRDSRCPMFIHH